MWNYANSHTRDVNHYHKLQEDWNIRSDLHCAFMVDMHADYADYTDNKRLRKSQRKSLFKNKEWENWATVNFVENFQKEKESLFLLLFSIHQE